MEPGLVGAQSTQNSFCTQDGDRKGELVELGVDPAQRVKCSQGVQADLTQGHGPWIRSSYHLS